MSQYLKGSVAMALINSVEVPLILPIQLVLWIASNLVIKCLAELSNDVWSRNLSGAMWAYDVWLSGVKKCWAYTALVQFSLTFSCLHLGIIYEYASEITVQISPCQRHPVWKKISRFAPLPKIKALVRRINIYSGTLRLSKATELLR